MRSAIVREAGGPEVIEIVDLEKPAPGPGEILVQVAYAALNPLDTHARANRIDWMHPGFPFTPGFEFAGRVVAVGEGVDTPAVGDRVACNGQWRGNAEFALADAVRAEIVPDDFSWQLAASYSTCAYTAWLLIHRAGSVRPGDRVAIHSAAGAVGALTTQIAKSAGAEVIALAGAQSKLAVCRDHGADHAVSYFDDDWPQQVMEATGGQGASLIIDGNAGRNALRNLECIAPLGKIVFLGATDGEAGSFSTAALIGRCCAVEGFVQYVHQQFSGGEEKVETHRRLASGEWTIPIGRVFPLEDLAAAHAAFEARELVGRALIEIGGEAV
jgi:NADPH2:quinone reductase